MKTGLVPSSWIIGEGRRLDAGPYLSGAFRARAVLARFADRAQPLASLTAGHNGGIYNGPQFRRVYVASAAHGVPFMTSSAIRLADLSDLPLLRAVDARSSKLAYLQLSPGMTLISCSGTIGRTAIVRDDMAHVWSSQDLIKVVPDPRKVPAGYLNAYLSCQFCKALITARTYGAIIPHLEPEHLYDLPVPRLGDAIEARVDAMVLQAGSARVRAAQLLRAAQQQLHESTGMRPSAIDNEPSASITHALASAVSSRMDAYYYSARCLRARSQMDGARCESFKDICEIAEVWIPGIFKRLYANDPTLGVPYITGADVFQLAPETDKYLMTRVAAEYGLVVEEGTILVQEAGQMGGLIGKSVLAGKAVAGMAVSNNMVRIKAIDRSDVGYLFAVLSSPAGVVLLARESAGSSIPHIDAGRVRRIRVPWAAKQVRQTVGRLVDEAISLRDQACGLDAAAWRLVENAIESGQ